MLNTTKCLVQIKKAWFSLPVPHGGLDSPAIFMLSQERKQALAASRCVSRAPLSLIGNRKSLRKKRPSLLSAKQRRGEEEERKKKNRKMEKKVVNVTEP